MITQRPFGKTNSGEEVTIYTIDNGEAKISVSDFGATLINFEVKDRDGKMTDIVLGYDSAEAYDNGRAPYFGATVGRFANRIGGARFTLNGKEYCLPLNNNGKHCLHGGVDGFSFRMYEIALGDDSISASIHSPDGEEGFPGNMDFTVKYTLVGAELHIEYFAVSDADTVASFTNHSYFNLSGATSGKSILDHTLQIDAEAYSEVDSDAFPTGDIHPVDNTVFDFRKPALLRDRLGCGDKLLAPTADGIDNNMILYSCQRELTDVATLYNAENGIKLECLTDLPGVQIYTSTFLDTIGKNNTKYGKFGAICLETQGFPDAPNRKYFPSATLKAGEKFYSKTVYKASVQ